MSTKTKSALVKTDVTILAGAQDVAEVPEDEAIRALATSGLTGMSILVMKSRDIVGRFLAPKTVNCVAVELHQLTGMIEDLSKKIMNDVAKPGTDPAVLIASAAAMRDLANAANAMAQTRLKAAEVNGTRSRRNEANAVGPQFDIVAETVQIAQPVMPASNG